MLGHFPSQSRFLLFYYLNEDRKEQGRINGFHSQVWMGKGSDGEGRRGIRTGAAEPKSLRTQEKQV